MLVRCTSRFGAAFTRGSAAVLAAAAITACAEPIQPTATASHDAASTAMIAADATTDRHMVLARTSGFGGDFADRVAALGGTLESVHGGAGFAVVSGLSADAAAQLAGNGDIADVQLDVVFQLEQPLAVAESEIAFDDQIASVANPATASRFSWQWNMRAIGAEKAWAAGHLGDASVSIAILDSGIDYDAPDLNGLVDMARSASFIPADDQITKTYFPSRHVMNDYHGHGTNVATQASSKAVVHAGVSSKATLIGVKVLSARGTGSLSAVLNGVLWAADQGADVANMSLGGGFFKAGRGRTVATINRVFAHANRQGMLIVVAAGNDRENLDQNANLFKTYCDAPFVLCVSSVGPIMADSTPDASSYFTNFGSAINVSAPGGNYRDDRAVTNWIWGTGMGSWVWSYCAKHKLVFLENGGLAYAGCQAGNRVSGMVGTSQAAPHVAGLAALLVPQVGRDRPAQLKQAILKSADDLGQPGKDARYGRGRINVANALGL